MTASAKPLFRVSLTADFYDADNSPRYPDIGLSVFEGISHIEIGRFPDHCPS